MPQAKGTGTRPDRKRSELDERGHGIDGVKISSVLPEQRELWYRAAALDERSFASWARKVLDQAARGAVRDSAQHATAAVAAEASSA